MKNSINLCIALLFLIVLGCSCPAKLAELAKKKEAPSSTPAPFSTPTVNPTAPVSKGEYDVTMDKYNQISVGTPRADVERILGGKGTEVSNNSGGGIKFTVNKWEGDNYKSIILSFKADKVMTRAQVGLK